MSRYRYVVYILAMLLIGLFILSGGKFSNLMSFWAFFIGGLMIHHMLSYDLEISHRLIMNVGYVFIQGCQMTLWIKNLHNFMFIMMILGIFTILFNVFWQYILGHRPGKVALGVYYVTCLSLLVFQHAWHNPVLIPITLVIQLILVLITYKHFNKTSSQM